MLSKDSPLKSISRELSIGLGHLVWRPVCKAAQTCRWNLSDKRRPRGSVRRDRRRRTTKGRKSESNSARTNSRGSSVLKVIKWKSSFRAKLGFKLLWSKLSCIYSNNHLMLQIFISSVFLGYLLNNKKYCIIFKKYDWIRIVYPVELYVLPLEFSFSIDENSSLCSSCLPRKL